MTKIFLLDIDENIVLQSYQQSRHMTGRHGFVRELYNAFNVLYNKPLSPSSGKRMLLLIQSSSTTGCFFFFGFSQGSVNQLF